MLVNFVREKFPKWAKILLLIFGGASIVVRVFHFVDDCIDNKDEKNVKSLVWAILCFLLWPIDLVFFVFDLIAVIKNQPLTLGIE